MLGTSLAIQADDQAIVAGFGLNSGDFFQIAVRFDTNGEPDLTFGTGGGAATFGLALGIDILEAVEVQADGKILLAGRSGESGSENFTLLRLEANGDLDTTFGGGDGLK